MLTQDAAAEVECPARIAIPFVEFGGEISALRRRLPIVLWCSTRKVGETGARV